MNYTKGEWKVTKHRPLDNYVIAVLGEKQYEDNTICRIEHTEYREEMVANANLIAASPDLYEALRELNYQLTGANIPYDNALFQAKVNARQALAKAKGMGVK